jgi:hypothetical protein
MVRGEREGELPHKQSQRREGRGEREERERKT